MSAVSLEGIENSFDNDSGELFLSLSLDELTKSSSILRKSIYDFDLDTPQGIEKLMVLLPIMDPGILKDIVNSVWKDYKSDEDVRKNRMEIKGYLLDYLESYEAENERPKEGEESPR